MATEMTTLAAETIDIEPLRGSIRGRCDRSRRRRLRRCAGDLERCDRRRPACIARCAGVADVVAAVRFARGRVADNYGADYERLCVVRAIYDPDNVFHVNQHIARASGR